MLRLKSKPTLIIALIVLIIGLVGGFFVFSKHDDKNKQKKDEATKNDKPALSVSLARPRVMQVPVTISANGNITAWQEASIGSEANGLRLTNVFVNVGDVVHAGQELARFAPETIQANVAQSEASLLQTQANAAQDFANAERAKSLDAEGALSKQDISLYMTNAKAAKAKIEAAQAVLNAQKLQLKFTKVIAPDDGIISSRTASVGAVVIGGTELFRMILKSRLEWRAEVTSDEVHKIKIGDIATIDSIDDIQIKGKVRMIAPTVDAQTRMALVYIDLPIMQNTNSPIKAGMYARGSIRLNESPALTLPQTAVIMRDGFNYVFALIADNKVEQIKVKTGHLVDDQLEILSPLPDNLQVVANGGTFLNNGDTVRVVASINTKTTNPINHSLAKTAP
ncbi:efflux RND transporter periplasmic adaptor subunit [Aquirhabdus sp.]|uniref:efflux RND transporter periplasmic adaptor subunit n=1 Tax=Aquirhabdus sp. TaxID=2824160 RepID=UPI00396CF1A4